MKKEYRTIELIVNNHPGVMSHITGLFSRRGYNLEGILCGVIGEGNTSVMYLLVEVNAVYPQVLSQLGKLYDVLELRERSDLDVTAFFRVECLFEKMP